MQRFLINLILALIILAVLFFLSPLSRMLDFEPPAATVESTGTPSEEAAPEAGNEEVMEEDPGDVETPPVAPPDEPVTEPEPAEGATTVEEPSDDDGVDEPEGAPESEDAGDIEEPVAEPEPEAEPDTPAEEETPAP